MIASHSRSLFGFAAATSFILLGAVAARADETAADLRARFDALVPPGAEKSFAKPVTTEGGEIAWGESYLLSALGEMFEATRDEKYPPLIIALADWIAKSRDSVQGLRDEFRGGASAPVWSSTRYSKEARYAWAVHTGMIVEPMARFAATVRRDPALAARWGADAGRLLKIAEDAAAAHEADFREGPAAGEGHLYSPYLKKHLPLNMQNALARAWIAIDDARGGEPKHRARVAALAQFMKNRMRPQEDGSVLWSYWPPLEGPEDKNEDVSHAAINADFVVLCFERGIVFTREDVARVEATLMKRVLAADGRVSDTVGGGEPFGKYAEAPLRWARLARHSPAARERLLEFSRRPEFASQTSALGLGLALLSLPPAPPAE